MLKNINKCVAISLLLVLVLGVGLYLCSGRSTDVFDVERFEGERMVQFFDEYEDLSQSGESENMLIVVSNKRPEEYGAVDIVEGPNRTYFLMYDSMRARDEAYEQFKLDETVTVDKNIEMQLVSYNSWGVERMGLDNAIETLGDGGEAVKVAVIDTGLDVELFRTNYPDRGLQAFDVESGSDAIEDMVDHNGHGTHVTGIIVDGTPSSVSIMAMRTSKGEKDVVYASDATTLIYRAINEGAKVINISLGAYEQVESQRVALDYARSLGVVTVAAAGNDGKTDILYPAGYDNTLSVSAVNPDLSLASFSNYGDKIDFAAPGVSIRSINGIQNGTSMATPHVAAAAAVLKSFNPDLSFDDTKDLLVQHVQDLGSTGWDQQFGYGFIDFNDAEFCSGSYCDKFGVFAMDEIAIQVEDRTAGVATIEDEKDGIKVTAEQACAVMVSYDDGETYERVSAMAVEGEDDAYKFEFEMFDQMQVLVALKGDVNMNGVVNARDSAAVSYYLLSDSNLNHRDLTMLEKLMADVNDSGTITARDISLINYAILSNNNERYRGFEW